MRSSDRLRPLLGVLCGIATTFTVGECFLQRPQPPRGGMPRVTGVGPKAWWWSGYGLAVAAAGARAVVGAAAVSVVRRARVGARHPSCGGADTRARGLISSCWIRTFCSPALRPSSRTRRAASASDRDVDRGGAGVLRGSERPLAAARQGLSYINHGFAGVPLALNTLPTKWLFSPVHSCNARRNMQFPYTAEPQPTRRSSSPRHRPRT